MYNNISLIDNILSFRFIDLYRVTSRFVIDNVSMLKVILLYAGYKPNRGMKIHTMAGSIRVKSLYEYKRALDIYGARHSLNLPPTHLEYEWLRVKGMVVLDIGANIGDTGIYFAERGASHVYSYEPYPSTFKKAKKAIAKRGFNNVISIFNEGVSGKNSVVRIDNNYNGTGSSVLRSFGKGTRIRVRTLHDLIKKHNIYNAILKMDCEGSEYGIILGANYSDLIKFKQIEIEYHYGYKNLKKKLKNAGFNVKVGRPRRLINLEAENPKMISGLIFAERK